MNKKLYDKILELLHADDYHCAYEDDGEELWYVSDQLYECKELLKLILLEEGCDEDE